MNPYRTPRPVRVSGAHGSRSLPSPSPPDGGSAPPVGSATGDGAAVSFLSEVLTGEASWTMGEVQRLIVVHDLARMGRWRASTLDDDDEASTS
jgi:hypothetical protein